jgi:hypothetical protein
MQKGTENAEEFKRDRQTNLHSHYQPPAMLNNHLVDLGHEAQGFVEGDDDVVVTKHPK